MPWPHTAVEPRQALKLADLPWRHKAVVRHIVEMHGGTVRADSAGKGRGATFTIELPLVAPLR